MAATQTALPFGADGYESFAGKGACRRCGCIAYWKRKCQRCYRKFCSSCAPQSLQKYGEGPEDECCIGCEPYLVVAPAESEPIFELEPESEDVSPIKGPIHVPLSATFAAANEPTTHDYKDDSPPVSYGTLCTESDSESNGEAGEDSSATDTMSTKSGNNMAQTTTTVDFLGIYPSWHDIQERLLPSTDTTSTGNKSCNHESPDSLSQIPTTPESSRETVGDLDSLTEPPLTPDAGCCTACHNYSTGKTPCPTCRTKYCHEARCQEYLYADGSCAKCRTKPRIASTIPALPVEAGCCTACKQFSIGKEPCETCGTKYCREEACQSFLFSNGTCVICHGEETTRY